MNLNSTSQNGTALPECRPDFFLVGKLATEANAVFVFLIVMTIIACPVTIVLNALVIICVKTIARLQTISNTALGCLAVTDWLMGVIGLPFLITVAVSIVHSETSSDFCWVKVLSRNILRILGAATVLHLALMNLERYLAIKHPFQHVTIVTKSRVIWSSALAWTTALLITLPFVTTDYNTYIAISGIFLLLSVVIVVYCQGIVYNETRRQNKRLAAHQVSVEAREKFLRDTKSFKITTAVLVTLLISYFPTLVVRILVTKSVMSENVAAVATFASTVVVTLNSLVNPVIYCVRTRQFRAAFIEVLLRKSRVESENFEVRMFGSSKSDDREERKDIDGNDKNKHKSSKSKNTHRSNDNCDTEGTENINNHHSDFNSDNKNSDNNINNSSSSSGDDENSYNRANNSISDNTDSSK